MDTGMLLMTLSDKIKFFLLVPGTQQVKVNIQPTVLLNRMNEDELNRFIFSQS